MNTYSLALRKYAQKEQQINFHLNLKPEKGMAFVSLLIRNYISPTENRIRERRDSDLQKFEFTVGMLVANCLYANETGKTAIFYSRSQKHYSQRKLGYYLPSQIGYTPLLSVIEGMEKAGFLTTTIGSNDLKVKERTQSTFSPTAMLLACIEEHKISGADILVNPKTMPAIKLKDKRKALKPIEISDPKILKLDTETRQINAHIASYNIRLILDDDKPLNDTKQLIFKSPYLTRIFNNSSYEEGGRFFNGWWQSESGKDRQKLTINGKPTIELDFSGFNTRAIYHHCGLAYDRDPYDIPPAIELLRSLGVTKSKEIRAIIKYQLNCMLAVNHHYKIPNPEREGFFEAKTMAKADIQKLRSLITDHHSEIEDYLIAGQGLKLQFIESEICRRVLLSSLKAKIPVLPIHDSFITTLQNRDWLKAEMVKAYTEELNFIPLIH